MASAAKELRPAEAFPAGEYLADELTARGWTVAEFSRIVDRPTQAISEIINGHKEITPATAALIAAATGTSASTWLRLQDTYRLWLLAHDGPAQQRATAAARRARMAELIPITELRRRGDLPDTDDLDELERAACELLGISSLDETPRWAAAARRPDADRPFTPPQQAWLGCAHRAAGRVSAKRFDQDALVELCQALTRLVADAAEITALPARFAKAGVRLVRVPPFKNSKIDGAAFTDGRGPVIALSGRIARLDSVLFTLLHECAHLVLGHTTDGALLDEDLGGGGHGAGREGQADARASTWALPDPLRVSGRVSKAKVLAEADRLGVHAAVIVGRLHHDGALAWSHLNGLIPNVRAELDSWP